MKFSSILFIASLSFTAVGLSAQSIDLEKQTNKAECQEKYKMLLQALSDTVPDSVTNLSFENIYGEKLPDLTPFKNIKHLEFKANAFKKLPQNVFSSQKLETVRIENCVVERIRFPKNTNIESVILSDNGLTKMPHSLKKCKNLRSLNLEGNNLKNIPLWIKKCNSLNEIVLNFNQIKLNKRAIRRLAKVENIQLAGNHIQNLPSNAGMLQAKKLNLAQNELSAFPESMGEMTQMTNIICLQNKFSEIPSSVAKMKNLKELVFDGNQIQEIPLFVGNLDQLEHLYLSDNDINVIPDTIRNLSHLKCFYVHRNDLLFIPRWLVGLDSLQRFGIGHNKLLVIPDLSAMKSLKELNIEENFIEKFPWELTEKKSLDTLILRDNPFILSEEETLRIEEHAGKPVIVL